jgi:hypothetical protein
MNDSFCALQIIVDELKTARENLPSDRSETMRGQTFSSKQINTIHWLLSLVDTFFFDWRDRLGRHGQSGLKLTFFFFLERRLSTDESEEDDKDEESEDEDDSVDAFRFFLDGRRNLEVNRQSNG